MIQSASNIALYACLGVLLGAGAGVRLFRSNAAGDAPSTWPIPALTGAVMALVAWRFGDGFGLVVFGYLTVVGVPLAVIDLVEQRLPSLIVLSSYGAVGLLITAQWVTTADSSAFARAAAGMAGAFLVHLLLALTAGGMGAGDVKLAGLVGLATAWVSWAALACSMVLAWLLAAVMACTADDSARARAVVVPLGPPMLLGALGAVLLSTQ